MNVAVVHYHLNRGGVAQVIANHLRALDAALPPSENVRVGLLHGGRMDGWPERLADKLEHLDVSLQVVPALDYDDQQTGKDRRAHRVGQLTTQLSETLERLRFAPSDTLLHVHNHSLGKNESLVSSIGEMARTGHRFLLQIHDFAEDFRPANYRALRNTFRRTGEVDFAKWLYPQSSAIHYATLTSRDAHILRRAGVPSDRLHLLPNPVIAPHANLNTMRANRDASRAKLTDRCGVPPGARVLLYPVRGIRRKNVAEAIFWSTLAPPPTAVAITLAPKNPREARPYERWRRFSQQHDLPCWFDVGGPGGLTFLENLAAAERILTTSVAEGFGMVFLEPWLVDRPLLGRDLPEVTTDFRAAGVCYDSLQPELRIPTDWLDGSTLRIRLQELYGDVVRAYGTELRSYEGIESFLSAETIDFARLPMGTQQAMIARTISDPRRRQEVCDLNDWLGTACSRPVAEIRSTIEANREAVQASYSLAAIGPFLRATYEKVLASDAEKTLESPASGERILQHFLQFARFHPIRVET